MILYCVDYVKRKMKNESWVDFIDGDGKQIDNTKSTIYDAYRHWVTEQKQR